jgi:DNA-directed RNA polymerase specialized sigma24 family protein
MRRFRPKPRVPSHSAYATCSDFCERFIDDLQPLYLLAFLLTGSHAEAEQCFITTLADAVRANCVFRGWERSWSKRCLIINAVRRVFPRPTENRWKRDALCEGDLGSRGRSTINAVSRLAPPLQRVVFVMSVLERYSEHECALLLGCTPRDVVEARLHALWQLSGLDPAFEKTAG